MLKRELLDILCCPKCKSDLEYRSAEDTLTCTRCATVYPVRNDIPILLVAPEAAQEAHEPLEPHAGHAQDPHKPGSGHDARQ